MTKTVETYLHLESLPVLTRPNDALQLLNKLQQQKNSASTLELTHTFGRTVKSILLFCQYFEWISQKNDKEWILTTHGQELLKQNNPTFHFMLELTRCHPYRLLLMYIEQDVDKELRQSEVENLLQSLGYHIHDKKTGKIVVTFFRLMEFGGLGKYIRSSSQREAYLKTEPSTRERCTHILKAAGNTHDHGKAEYPQMKINQQPSLFPGLDSLGTETKKSGRKKDMSPPPTNFQFPDNAPQETILPPADKQPAPPSDNAPVHIRISVDMTQWSMEQISTFFVGAKGLIRS